MNAVVQVSKSPLDNTVQQILDAPGYLNETQCERLLNIIKLKYPLLINPEKKQASGTPSEMIAATIESLQNTIEKMSNASVFGTDGQIDTASLKRIVDSQEKLVKLLTRLGDQLSASDRQEAFESAISEALEAIENQALKDSFLSLLHSKLAEKSQIMKKNQ